MHGYDLRKRLRGDFGLLSSLSFGSLYPALARLEAAGAVREVPSDRTPDGSASGAWAFPHAGSIAGERAAFRARLAYRRAAPARSGGGTRGRRVYELTARGDEVFRQLLEAGDPKPEDGRGFALRWAFARHLSPEERLILLQRRRGELVAIRDGSRRAVESPRRPLDRYERSLVEHATESTEHDLSWIERLIATEQAALTNSPVAGAKVRSASNAEATATLRRPAVRTGSVIKIGSKERSEP